METIIKLDIEFKKDYISKKNSYEIDKNQMFQFNKPLEKAINSFLLSKAVKKSSNMRYYLFRNGNAIKELNIKNSPQENNCIEGDKIKITHSKIEIKKIIVEKKEEEKKEPKNIINVNDKNDKNDTIILKENINVKIDLEQINESGERSKNILKKTSESKPNNNVDEKKSKLNNNDDEKNDINSKKKNIKYYFSFYNNYFIICIYNYNTIFIFMEKKKRR